MYNDLTHNFTQMMAYFITTFSAIISPLILRLDRISPTSCIGSLHVNGMKWTSHCQQYTMTSRLTTHHTFVIPKLPLPTSYTTTHHTQCY